MSVQAKRELLAQTGPRYRVAPLQQKRTILDEFVAATGYARKYAIRLLGQPSIPLPAPVTRPRARVYGPEVVEALTVTWAASNYVCAKRLVPFLPDLVASLERHGHLTLSAEVRAHLLTLSAATADRLLRPTRERTRPRGIGTTKVGTLLKHKVPIRTFAEWDDVRPGFMEADLVAHCGTRAEGPYLSSLVLTDVATGWTECLPLLRHGYDDVIHALDQARLLLPVPLRGLDTDNGREFLNYPLLAYCTQAEITFTRGRAYRKNDQCYVEQKNGSIVRQIVGYDRFEGELAYHQLAELYRALRLYVNVFQPSLKLVLKRRDGSHVYRRYDTARTPLQRLLTADVLDESARTRLVALAEALDPVHVLRHLQRLQEALWRHAVAPAPATPEPTVRFALPAGVPSGTAEAPTLATFPQAHRRPRPIRRRVRGPQTDHARPDPFAGEWDTIDAWLTAQPERPASALRLDRAPTAPAYPPDGPCVATTAHAGDERRPEDDTSGGARPVDRRGVVDGYSIICAACGARDTISRGARGPVTAYCAVCRQERTRDQARQRMVVMRARQRGGEQPCG
jgi:hypothetical protein